MSWRASMLKIRGNWQMQNSKMRLFAVMLPLAIAGCASSATSSVVGTPQAEVPAPAAWAMTPASNSLQLLDELFSISEPVSSQTGQK